jgi:hypothetical protein
VAYDVRVTKCRRGRRARVASLTLVALATALAHFLAPSDARAQTNLPVTTITAPAHTSGEDDDPASRPVFLHTPGDRREPISLVRPDGTLAIVCAPGPCSGRATPGPYSIVFGPLWRGARTRVDVPSEGASFVPSRSPRVGATILLVTGAGLSPCPVIFAYLASTVPPLMDASGRRVQSPDVLVFYGYAAGVGVAASSLLAMGIMVVSINRIGVERRRPVNDLMFTVGLAPTPGGAIASLEIRTRGW